MLIRRCDKAKNGWNNGDLDVAFQLFSCGMVRDGNLCSKASRSHLVHEGYAVQYQGVTALTGKGTIAFLRSPVIWRSAFNRWRNWRRNPLIAPPDRVREALR